MRAAVPTLMSLVLMLAFAGEGNAASSQKKQARHSYGQAYAPPGIVTDELRRRNARAYERGEYYEHDSNALAVGSKAWFDQKRNEDGCC